MRVVNVALGARSYRILVGPGLLAKLGRECQKLDLGARCAVITDATVGPLWASQAIDSLQQAGFAPVLITVAAGEKAKRLATVGACYDQLAEHRLERKSFVVALGGGVVGDLAGFVAATYLRGLPFVQVPTTLLAQVDSSVGGKTGVNLRAGKNLVGSFHQPRLVLADLDLLRTLPEREYRSGLAEVVKYGIIRDVALFRRLDRDLPRLLARDPHLLAAVVARSCEIKADVVGADETEGGVRAILNFGHTIGHALEAISRYGRFLHGEAISIGQVVAAELSATQTGLPEAEVERIRRWFVAAGLPVSIALSGRERAALFEAMRLDKKVASGEIRFVLASRIGAVTWGQRVPEPALLTALDRCRPTSS